MLITGAGSGLGREVALLAADAGAKVIVTDKIEARRLGLGPGGAVMSSRLMNWCDRQGLGLSLSDRRDSD